MEQEFAETTERREWSVVSSALSVEVWAGVATCLEKIDDCGGFARKMDGKTRCFCGVGCTTVFRFDWGVVFHEENEGFSCDKLRASRPGKAGGEPTMSRTGPWRIVVAPADNQCIIIHYISRYVKWKSVPLGKKLSVVGGQLSKQAAVSKPENPPGQALARHGG